MIRPSVATHPPRVLIVDDELPNRQLLEAMLATQGYFLEHAGSGEEALALLERHPPDLILLDVMMPGMDGFQVATRVKRKLETRTIPIIMITAMDDSSARMLGLGVGVDDYLTKPVDRALVCARVSTLLRLKAYSDYYDKHSQKAESAADAASHATDLADGARLDRALFDAAPVGIVHVDWAGNLVRVNKRLCDLLGYTREDVLTMAPGDLLQSTESSVEAESIRQLRAGTQDRHLVEKKKYRRRDGSEVLARLSMSVQRDKDGTPRHVISVIEDVSHLELDTTAARPKRV